MTWMYTLRKIQTRSSIYATLEEKHVKFISIKENIDTALPIGKAVMYVTMAFAQMERATIAARLVDILIGLAKKGFWTGGNPPYGYRFAILCGETAKNFQ